MVCVWVKAHIIRVKEDSRWPRAGLCYVIGEVSSSPAWIIEIQPHTLPPPLVDRSGCERDSGSGKSTIGFSLLCFWSQLFIKNLSIFYRQFDHSYCQHTDSIAPKQHSLFQSLTQRWKMLQPPLSLTLALSQLLSELLQLTCKQPLITQLKHTLALAEPVIGELSPSGHLPTRLYQG